MIEQKTLAKAVEQYFQYFGLSTSSKLVKNEAYLKKLIRHADSISVPSRISREKLEEVTAICERYERRRLYQGSAVMHIFLCRYLSNVANIPKWMKKVSRELEKDSKFFNYRYRGKNWPQLCMAYLGSLGVLSKWGKRQFKREYVKNLTLINEATYSSRNPKVHHFVVNQTATIMLSIQNS